MEAMAAALVIFLDGYVDRTPARTSTDGGKTWTWGTLYAYEHQAEVDKLRVGLRCICKNCPAWKEHLQPELAGHGVCCLRPNIGYFETEATDYCSRGKWNEEPDPDANFVPNSEGEATDA